MENQLKHENGKADMRPYKNETIENKFLNPAIVTTLGLVIHCIADGLALGTSVFCKHFHYS